MVPFCKLSIQVKSQASHRRRIMTEWLTFLTCRRSRCALNASCDIYGRDPLRISRVMSCMAASTFHYLLCQLSTEVRLIPWPTATSAPHAFASDDACADCRGLSPRTSDSIVFRQSPIGENPTFVHAFLKRLFRGICDKP